MTQITIDNILQAAERINVHRTPVLTCTTLDNLASKPDAPVELFFKCELFQKTGCKYILLVFCIFLRYAKNIHAPFSLY